MHIIRDIIYGITLRGADMKRVCNDLGIEPHQLNDSEKFVPYKPAAQIWNVALKYTGDELIGLHLGEELNATILGMLGYLMQTSQNLLEAFSMLTKYNELYSTMMMFVIKEQENEVFISYEPVLRWREEYPESARQSVDIGMAGTLTILKILAGRNVFPVRVELAYAPRHIQEYERVFRTLISFQAKENKLTFRKSDLLHRVISHDKSLFTFFNSTLEQKLNRINTSTTLEDQIRKLIIRDFKGRVPSAEVMASQINLTVRSLQRRLKEENTSYRDVTQSIKRELALALMKNPTHRMGEIADILGYSNLSSFSKALKKWSADSE